MLRMPRTKTLVILWAALSVILAVQAIAMAHETRKVGAYTMIVGWADEPPYVGFKNAVQATVKDSAGKAVTGLGDDLKVEVIFGDKKTAQLALTESDEIPGQYMASIIPTRPGNYTFHFVGSIKKQAVDQSFTSSEKTFDPVAEAADVEFPAKDPSAAQLAEQLTRLGPRIDAAQSAASQSKSLAILGIVLGALGSVVSLAARRRGMGRP
jgi:hypothetical protein